MSPAPLPDRPVDFDRSATRSEAQVNGPDLPGHKAQEYSGTSEDSKSGPSAGARLPGNAETRALNRTDDAG